MRSTKTAVAGVGLHMHTWVSTQSTVVPAFLGLCLAAFYVLLRTTPRTDHIRLIVPVEQGEWGRFFDGNYMLYRPLVWLFYQLWLSMGYSGRVLIPAQVMSALAGGFGVAVLHKCAHRLTRDRTISLLASAACGFSLAYIEYSTDLNHILVADVFLLLTFYWLIVPPSEASWLGIVPLALLSALSILFHKAHVLFVPVAIAGLLSETHIDLQSKLRNTSLYLLLLAGVVGICYLTVGLWQNRVHSFQDLVLYFTSYAGSRRLPMWGSFGPAFGHSRFEDALLVFVGSLAPPWNGIAIRALLMRGQFKPRRMMDGFTWFSVGSLGIAAVLWSVSSWRQLTRSSRHWLSLGLFWFTLYGIFNVWWDPWEPKWWVIPIIIYWLVAAIALSEVCRLLPRIRKGVLIGGTALIVLLVGANTATVWTRSISRSADLHMAHWVGARMAPGDLMVKSAWNWAGYLPYFAEREEFCLIGQQGDRESILAQLNQEIARRQERGNRVFMQDVNGFSDNHWAWLEQQMGIGKADLAAFQSEPVWSQEGKTTWELQALPYPPSPCERRSRQ